MTNSLEIIDINANSHNTRFKVISEKEEKAKSAAFYKG